MPLSAFGKRNVHALSSSHAIGKQTKEIRACIGFWIRIQLKLAPQCRFSAAAHFRPFLSIHARASAHDIFASLFPENPDHFMVHVRFNEVGGKLLLRHHKRPFLRLKVTLPQIGPGDYKDIKDQRKREWQ